MSAVSPSPAPPVPHWIGEECRVFLGDSLAVLRTFPAESVHCVVTSPPYFGLRDYGVAGQMGLEITAELYLSRMVAVFREVRRVLRKDGTCWVNMGDSYAASPGKHRTEDKVGAKQATNCGSRARGGQGRGRV